MRWDGEWEKYSIKEFTTEIITDLDLLDNLQLNIILNIKEVIIPQDILIIAKTHPHPGNSSENTRGYVLVQKDEKYP